MALDLADLQRELQISSQSVADSLILEDFDLDPQCKTSGKQTDKNWLTRLIVRRIVWRRS